MLESHTLLLHVLSDVTARLTTDASDPEAWRLADEALALCAEEKPELAETIRARDAEALGTIVEGWRSGKRLLSVHDRNVLKRALKSFRKSLKLTRLDAESTIGGGPMSGGRESGIVGITPPAHYPRAVWDELVRQGRLLDSGRGTYELAPE